MTNKKLGKGLGSLLATRHASEATADGSPLWVSLDQLRQSQEQPRKDPEKGIKELAGSLRRHGMMQPIVVTQSNERGYEILAGERRWRAARLAGLKSVPILIRASPSSQGERLELALIENIQREDLNAMERASACHRLVEEYQLTQAQVADRLGFERPTVANLIRLLELPEAIQGAVSRETITAGHARALLRLNGNPLQDKVLAQITKEELSVRAAEALCGALAESGNNRQRQARPRKPAWVAEMQEKITRSLGVRAEVRLRQRGGGRLILHFQDLEGLDQLTQSWGLHGEAAELLES